MTALLRTVRRQRGLPLAAGDSAYFDAAISHRIRTVGPQAAEVVVAETCP